MLTLNGMIKNFTIGFAHFSIQSISQVSSSTQLEYTFEWLVKQIP